MYFWIKSFFKIPCHIMNVCPQTLKQAAWRTAFLKVFWSTRGSCHSWAAIKWLLTIRGHERNGGGGRERGRIGLQDQAQNSAFPICIIIKLLFKILIWAHYWFFSPPPQQLNQVELTTLLCFFFLSCHLLSSSSFSATQSQFYTAADWPKLAILWL